MITKKFIRLSGEKANVIKIDQNPETVINIHSKLKHGDLLHKPGGIRGSGAWVVERKKDTIKLHKTSDGCPFNEGHIFSTMISSEISDFIEDPVDFYDKIIDSSYPIDFIICSLDHPSADIIIDIDRKNNSTRAVWARHLKEWCLGDIN